VQIEEAIARLKESVLAETGPSVIYPIIDRLCQIYSDGSAADREKILAIGHTARIPLLAYGWFSAEEAVRTESPDRISSGLIALIIEGGAEDLRDDIMRLAVLFHSACLLKMNAVTVFGDIARLSGNAVLAEEIRAFPTRPPGTRDLPAFFVRERNKGLEFKYEDMGANYKPRKGWRWPWQRSR